MSDWRHRAKCRDMDPELWFPMPGDRKAIGEAKKWCRACPVATECRDDALTNGQTDGIWGGLDETERRRLSRARAGVDQTRLDRKVVDDLLRGRVYDLRIASEAEKREAVRLLSGEHMAARTIAARTGISALAVERYRRQLREAKGAAA